VIKNKILILEGGFNEEHEVSLKTSAEIQKIFKKNKIQFSTLKVNPANFERKISKFKNYVCFNALHGPFGEDGQVQKILKKFKIKFTHSGIKSSALCFNKFATKKVIFNNKILTPKFIILKTTNINKDKLIDFKKKYKKFVIKPIKSGSSFGVTIIKNNKDLKLLINKINTLKSKLSLHKYVILEEFISGKELTVATIQFTKKIIPLAVTEIKPSNSFFDYQSKYSEGYAKHILPANITKKNYKKCLNIAVKSHSILKCKSIARTDFIFKKTNNKIYFLETNTQPGLTSLSLLPEQAKFKNISFEKIILGILKKIN
tara:strand:- start:80 stop:1027 length:948 start_codon:yes stop_codon:yes gene_type:complete